MMSQISEIPASAYTPEMETLGALPDIPTFDGEPVPVSRNPLTSGTRPCEPLPKYQAYECIEHSSPCLPIEPFEQKGKTYLGLEIFVHFDPKALESVFEKKKKEEEKEPKKEGVEGPQAADEDEKEEQEKEGQSAQEKEEESNRGKASAHKEEEEDPAKQVLKVIRAYIEESF
ncbi:hypothetical protein JCGZ_03153 [Jatropha curcas]|uniref:Uncharacterized protein n=1 Tax=Jatropha curcas TaxID=180498 RepID=A0A067KY04_JATCU|nr:hypothetical protein JCGZ_03153 [Jatropha curcas]